MTNDELALIISGFEGKIVRRYSRFGNEIDVKSPATICESVVCHIPLNDKNKIELNAKVGNGWLPTAYPSVGNLTIDKFYATINSNYFSWLSDLSLPLSEDDLVITIQSAIHAWHSYISQAVDAVAIGLVEN